MAKHKAKRRRSDRSPQRGRSLDWALIALGIILVVGLGLRIAYLRESFDTPDFAVPLVDAEYHDYWARGVAFGQWAPPVHEPDPMIRSVPFFRPPGYPYFLAAVYKLLGPGYVAPRVVQLLIGLLNVILAFLFARRYLGRAAAVILSAFMATYWIFIYFEGELLEPSLSIALTLALLHVLMRWVESPRAVLLFVGGIVTGALALVRPNALAYVPFVVLWLAWILSRRAALRGVWVAAALFVAGTALAVSPATIRNAVVARDFVLVSSNSGFNLFIGNNDRSDGLVRGTMPGVGTLDTCFDHRQIVRNVQSKLGRSMRDSEVSDYLAGEAFRWMRAHPGRMLQLIGTKTLLFWGPAETGGNTVVDSDRRASKVLRSIPIGFPIAAALGLIGAILLLLDSRRRRERGVVEEERARRFEMAVLAAVMILVWYASHMPFAVTSRYRVPMIPLLFLFGAYLLTRLWSFWRERDVRRLLLWGGALVFVASLASVNFAGYDVNTARWHYQRGIAFMRAGKVDDAIAEYRLALEQNPDYGAVYNDAAVALASQGRYAESVPYFEGAIRIRSTDPSVRFNFAMVLELLGRLERSRDEYAEAVRLEPRDLEARAGLQRVERALAAASME